MKKINYYIENNIYIALIFVLFFQVGLIVFFGCLKSNFHQDELFSYESAHYIGDNTPRNCYMHESELFSQYTWLEVGDFKELLVVNEDSSILKDHPISIIKKFVLGNPHVVLLNIFESLFFKNIVSKWAGIILNIIFYVITQCVIYKLIYRLTNSRIVALYGMIFYGFSAIAISFAVYTRFYTYSLMMIAIAINLHYSIWKHDDKWLKNFIYEILALLCLVQAFRGSELMAVIAAGWFISFAIGLLLQKKWLKLLVYVSPGCVGCIYLFNYFFIIKDAILNPAKYMDGSGQPIDLIFTNISNLSGKQLVKRVLEYINNISISFFGSIFIFLFILILIGILYVCCSRKVEKKNEQCEGFIYIIGGMVLIYSIFAVVAGLWLPRYHALMYPQLAIIFIYILYRCIYYMSNICRYIVVGSCCIGLIVGILFRVDYIYISDQSTVQRMHNISSNDNVIWNIEDFQIIMECVYLSSDNSRMYVVSESDDLHFDDYDEDFYLWISESETLDEEQMSIFNQHGYIHVEDIGIASDARIYYCSKVN